MLTRAEMEAADGSEDLAQEFDRNYVLENYLQTQALSKSNAGNSTVVTEVESTDEPLKEDPSKKDSCAEGQARECSPEV